MTSDENWYRYIVMQYFTTDTENAEKNIKIYLL